MKQLLFLLFSILFGLNTLQAQETNPIEETTWNVIAQRFFNGDNSNVIRFEDDIEFKLIGDVTSEDSVILEEIIIELNELIEIVDVRFAENYGNFLISVISLNHRVDKKPMMRYSKGQIESFKLEIITEKIKNKEEKKRYYYYYILRNLTETFNPHMLSGYNGIFKSNTFPQFNHLSELDKDIIRKIYSENFYADLKTNTIKNYGFLFYLNLRYKHWVKRITTSLSIILIVVGFLYLLSVRKNKHHITFWSYQKSSMLVLLWISLAYTIFYLTDYAPVGLYVSIWPYLIANFAATVFSWILAPVLLYYLELWFLKKIDKFFQKQIFIFVATLISIFVSYVVTALPFIYLNSRDQINSSHFNLFNPFTLYIILIIATLRVFYNFINYRIQSMVNQKDVELAKMKELKNQAELNALHSRINPHFLYNSLNSIASLAHINPDKTENMATALSELFRYSINKEDKTFVQVEEELEMVKKYLEIEKTRFGDKLNYSIKLDDNAKEKLIPKFLIQPLAENAIKHGLSKVKDAGKITIEVKQLENDLVIVIFDNGPDFPEEPVSGYGLQNLNDKLEIIYGKDAFIYWENGNNKHFKITIKNQF